jgi:hypothetical protein
MGEQWYFVSAPPNLWARTGKGTSLPVVLLAMKAEPYSSDFYTKVLLAGSEEGEGGWEEQGAFSLYFGAER